MIRAGRAGSGAVITKSFNRKGREGYRNPSFIEVHGSYLNALGIPNPGMEEMKSDIADVRKAGVKVIASVFGFDAEEFAEAASAGEQAGALAVELNVSCPHVEEVGIEIGQSPRRIGEVVKAVKRKVRIPVIAKLTPNVTSIQEIAKAAEGAGADALSAVNTALGMAIDVEAGRPILGVGGISDWKDALEFMMAGASAVEIGTAVAYKGIGVFEEINRGISRFLLEHNYSSVRDVVGMAHKPQLAA